MEKTIDHLEIEILNYKNHIKDLERQQSNDLYLFQKLIKSLTNCVNEYLCEIKMLRETVIKLEDIIDRMTQDELEPNNDF